PLLPPAGDPAYATVLEAERWGDEPFQNVPRRILDVALLRRPRAMESFVGDAKLPLPVSLMRPAMGLTARMMAIKNKASDAAGRADPAARRGQLAGGERGFGGGRRGGEHPTPAALKTGSTTRLLPATGDVRPRVAGRGAARLERYFPPMVGEI